MIPNISRTIVGSRIVGVVCRGCEDCGYYEGGRGNYEKELYCPGGEIWIKLDNGLVFRCWNSEWGGLCIEDESWTLRYIDEELNKDAGYTER